MTTLPTIDGNTIKQFSALLESAQEAGITIEQAMTFIAIFARKSAESAEGKTEKGIH
jgi:hypothetical protein